MRYNLERLGKCFSVIIACLVILNLSFVSAISASEVVKFQHIDTSDGLPDRTVWSMLQSQDGLIWIGSSKGLVRYSGYDFRVYRNSNLSTRTFESNVVRALHLTSDNNILLGTYAGLSKLDLANDKLDTVDLMLTDDQYLSDLSVYDILKSKTGNYWLSTDSGVVKLNSSFELLDYSGLPNSHLYSLYKYRLNTSCQTISGTMIFGGDNQLVLFDKDKNEIIPIEFPTKSKVNVKKVICRGDGSAVIATSIGLFKLAANSTKVKEFVPSLSGKYAVAILEDKKGELWVGTQDDGLYFLDKNLKLKQFSYSKGDMHSIADNDAYSLLLDRSNSLWIGTFNAGISRLNLDSTNFEFFEDGNHSIFCMNSPVIYSIFEESSSIFWLGTQKGLVRVDSEQGICENQFNIDSSTGKLLEKEILSINQNPYQANFLDIGTNGGMVTIDLFDYKRAPKQIKNVSVNVYDSIVSNSGARFLATSRGLYVKELGSDKFEKIGVEDGVIEPRLIFQLLEDEHKNILVASWSGLYSINKLNMLVRPDWIVPELIQNPIRAMHISKDDDIWLGVDNIGLFQYSSNGKLVEKFDDPIRLPAIKGFSSIAEDNDHRLWISGTSGISLLNPKNGQFDNFVSSDGLQSDIFTRGAKFVSLSGRIYFGGRKGLTRFFPSQIKRNIVPPEVLLSGFLYFNKKLQYGEYSNEFTLPKPIERLTSLQLSHKDYVFGFEFAALHFADPSRNQYAYMMENWDEGWNYTSAKFRRATYSNLPAGDYVFKVKASNNHGAWNEKPLEVKINISPAPWASPLAYTLYVLVSLIAIFLLIYFRTRSLQKRSVQLENSVNQRTKELADEKGKVELLLSQKNEEFANVSHEFRTPLTLILGPLAKLLQSKQKEDNFNRLNIIQRNSYRLLRMVDQLLNLETFRVKAITQRSPQAVGKTIKLLAEAFVDLAREKEIELIIKDIDLINFEFTDDAIEKIILNLLSNAVKYTKPNGQISIEAKRDGDIKYIITVSDTGIGIPQEKIDSIFERYSRILDSNSEQVTGAGIGLALVKSMVESHNGSIHIDSELSIGTTFAITLPIINEVTEKEVKSHANQEIIAMELMSLTGQSKSEVSSSETKRSILAENKPLVLVIEDNQDMREFIAESINDDYLAITAKDGAEGVALAIKEIPDLIISDIMMPNIDGYQTTRLLRENELTNHIPIVLLTARGDRDSRIKGWTEKADEYLTKPFDVEELKIRLSNLLEIRDILKRRFSESIFNKEFASEPPTQVIQTLDSLVSETSEPSLNQAKQQAQEEFVRQIELRLEKIYINPDVSVADIAANLAMSERQLFRKLKSVLDMTPAEYLRRFRLEKAKALLAEGRSISYTAMEVGFSSQSYFGKCFRAQYGMTPSEFSSKH